MKITYRTDIDGLRAVSIFAVLIFHFFPNLAKGGFIGVDIFFVISGYLITNIILSELGSGSFSFVSFFVRRIRRIFPALIFVLAIVALAGYYLMFDNELKLLAKHLVANSFFSINIVLYKELGYFDISSHLKPLLHLWSLAVEEQFYFFYPIILVLATRKNINIISLLCFVITISFFLNIKLLKYPNMSFYMPFTRAWELLMGGMLVYIIDYSNTLRFKKFESRLNFACNKILFSKPVNDTNLFKNIISFLGIGVIGWFVVSFSKISNFPGRNALFPVLGAMCIIWAGPQAWINKKVLSSRIFVLGGKISYPLYLWHWPLLSFFTIVSNGKITNLTKILLIFISIILALATYFLLEKPIKKLKSIKNIAVICILLNLVIMALGVYIYRNGIQNRMINNLSIKQELNPEDASLYANLIPCSKIGSLSAKLAGYCYSKSNTPEFAIVGDSHAIATGYGVINTHNLNAIFVSYSGAIPLYNYVSYTKILYEKSNRVQTFREMVKVIDTLAQMDSIKYIVLNSRGPIYLEGNGFGVELQDDNLKNWILEQSDGTMIASDNYDIFIKEYSSIIQRVHHFGKKVVFAIDIPELGVDPNECLFRFGVLGQENNANKCIVKKEVYDKRNYQYRKMVDELKQKFPYMIVFDPVDLFCDEEKCYGVKGNKLLYNDDDHLNVVGAGMLAKKLKSTLMLD